MFFAITASAQVSKETMKEVRAAQKSLDAKSPKAARTEAKKYAKDGWKPLEGTLPLEKQLEEAYTLMNMKDEDFNAKFLIGTGAFSTDDKATAVKFATDAARLDIAEQLETQIAESIKREGGSSNGTAINDVVSASRTLVKNRLTGTQPVVRMYRQLKNGQYEVQITLPFSLEKAKRMAKDVIREELKSKSEELAKELDQIKF